MAPVKSNRNVRESVSSWMSMLQARVVQNAAATVEEQPNGDVIVEVKLKRPWFLVPPLNWIFRVRDRKRVLLNGIGKEVWQLCIGDVSVEQIVDEIAKRYRLTFHEARVAVTSYIRELVSRGVVVLVVENQGTRTKHEEG